MAKEVVVDVDLFNEVVARNLAAIREEKGLSQKKLAELSGIDNAIISRIEKQGYSKRVDAYYIQQLAMTLDVDADAITESNPRISELIGLLDKEVHKVPASEKVIAASEELLTSTQSRGPRERALAFLYHGLIWYYKGQYARATEEYEKAYQHAQVSRVDALIRRIQRNLASSLMMIGMYGRSEIMIRSILAATPNQVKKERAEDLYKLASLYNSQGEVEKAESTLFEILSFVEQDQACNQVRVSALQALGYVYKLHKNYDLAEQYTRDAIELATSIKDFMTVLYSHKTIGEIFTESGEVEKAVNAFTEGVLIAQQIGRKFEEGLFRFEIAYALDDYSTMKNVLLEFGNSQSTPRQIVGVYERIAEKAFQLGLIEDVRNFYKKANEILKHS